MLIANNPRYIQNKEITEYATLHPEECALIFTTIPDVDITQDKDGKILYLASSSGDKNNRIDIDSSQFNKVIALADVNYNHFQEHKKYIPEDLAGTLKYHYDKCKENKVFFCTLDFALEADVSDSSIRAYLSGIRIPNERIKVLKMGLAMQLSTPYLLDLLNKYDDNKRNITNENILFNSIIYNCGETRTSLEDVYYVLKANNNEGLLKMSNTWLTNHGIV